MQFDFNNHLNNEVLQQNRLKARSYFIPYKNKATNAGNIAGTKNTTRCHSLSGENVFVELTYKRNGKICGSEQHIVKRTLPVITQKHGGEIKVTETAKKYIFDCGNVKYYFSKHTATFENFR